MGRCGHRPLQITTKNQRILWADRVVRPYKRDTIDRLYHRIPYIKYRPCRDISGARNRPILQTSGVFVKFIFHAVGVDAYIDPQETAVLWRFSGESVLISHFPPLQRVLKTTRVRRKIAASPVSHRGGPMWASAPTKDLTKRNIFPFRAVGVDAARRYRQSPYKIHRKEPIPWKKSDRTRYPASWSCCLRRRRRWRP